MASKRSWPLLESREEPGAQEGSAQPGGRGRAQLVVWMWPCCCEGPGPASVGHGEPWKVVEQETQGPGFHVCVWNWKWWRHSPSTLAAESSSRENFHPGEKGCEAQRPSSSCRKENVGTGRWRRKHVAGGAGGGGQGSYLRSGIVSPGACILAHTFSGWPLGHPFISQFTSIYPALTGLEEAHCYVVDGATWQGTGAASRS